MGVGKISFLLCLPSGVAVVDKRVNIEEMLMVQATKHKPVETLSLRRWQAPQIG